MIDGTMLRLTNLNSCITQLERTSNLNKYYAYFIWNLLTVLFTASFHGLNSIKKLKQIFSAIFVESNVFSECFDVSLMYHYKCFHNEKAIDEKFTSDIWKSVSTKDRMNIHRLYSIGLDCIYDDS